MKSATANDLAARIKRLTGGDDTLAMPSNELYGANRFDDQLVLDAMNQAIKAYGKATERTRSDIIYAIDDNNESRLPFDNMEIKQAVVVFDDEYVFNFDADHIVLTYAFTDGLDLDTRTKIVSPTDAIETYVSALFGWSPNNHLGWYRGISTRAVGSVNDFMTWGGDNTGTGVESIHVNISQIRIDKPEWSNIKLDCRCFWYEQIGVNPVKLDVVMYKGGTLVQDGFGFTNPTAQETRVLEFVTKKVTLKTTEILQDGERICVLNYNMLTGTGFVDVNDNTVY